MVNLTEARIRALKPRKAPYDIRDKNLRAFGFRVLPSVRQATARRSRTPRARRKTSAGRLHESEPIGMKRFARKYVEDEAPTERPGKAGAIGMPATRASILEARDRLGTSGAKVVSTESGIRVYGPFGDEVPIGFNHPCLMRDDRT